MPLGSFRLNSLAKKLAAAVVTRTAQAFTVFGNTKQSVTQSKFRGSSLTLDGSSDYIRTQLTIPAVKTLECWIRLNNVSGEKYVFRIHDSSDNFSWVFGVLNTNLYMYAGGTSSGGTLAANTWYHIALVDDGSSMAIALNGTFVASRGSAGQITNAYVYLGGFSNSLGVNGFIDELRISNIRRYTANFTPSTTPFVSDANTLLLLHMDGPYNQQLFRDDVGTTRSAVDGVSMSTAGTGVAGKISTAQAKFGSSSLYFNGTYGPVRHVDVSITGAFTIEGWIRGTSSWANYRGIWSDDTSSHSIRINSAGKLQWWMVTGSDGMSSTTTLSLDTWYHFAIVRESTTVKMYLNGSLENSYTNVTTNYTGAQKWIGAGWNYGESDYFYGWIDEFRISNIARYTANFTPSTTAFSNDANTLLLWHCEGSNDSLVVLDDNN